MAIIPTVPRKTGLSTKTCARCGIVSSSEDFAVTRSIFYKDGRLPICNDCISQYLKEHNYEWNIIDKVCQWADIPWIVKEWDRLVELANGDPSTVWPTYAKVFSSAAYTDLGWGDYYRQYKRLKEVGLIEEELPAIREQRYRDLRRKWGENYDDEALNYLEDLYKGLIATQNVSGALQIDQAQKICKLSLEIDSRIRAGDKDVDKFLSSYDKLVKTAEFTPKNTKNAADFDSIAELAYWVEKGGYQNKFYDNVTRDVVDETLKNIETYNQRLYINEGGIGEAITDRLTALKNVQPTFDDVYGIQPDFNEDEYENAGFIVEDFDPEEGNDRRAHSLT